MATVVAAIVEFVASYAMVIEAVLVVAAVVVQQEAAAAAKRKQEAAAREAARKADEAKGVQLVTAGEVATLKVVYGRNFVGGIRVYHNTFNNFIASAPAAGGQVFTAGGLESTITGTKHEFLITQQALCFGGIQACYAVDIDDRKINGEYVNAYNEVVYDGTGTLISPYTFGCKTHIYLDGNVADPLMIANDAARANSVFTNTAYATCVYRLNRDDSQYSGVPTAQFYIEGMRVKHITGSVGNRTLTSTKTYSNNPALCIIDYLTNTLYGRGLPESELDLDSFYTAYIVSETVINSNVPINGKLLKGRGSQLDIKMYECNMTLDSSVAIRDNIEKLLETFGDAQLIWSGGKYKLQIDCPTVYDNAVTYAIGHVVQISTETTVDLYECILSCSGVAPPNAIYWKLYTVAEITDNDIVRDGTTSISWPNAQTRLNFATCRYLNEAKDFKEDTVSWPDKLGAVYADYLSQDSGELLETEIFATGVGSYYSALAKAEQLVRTSRSATTYEFTVNRYLIYLEPGDKIKVTSEVLGIPGELLRVLETLPDGDGKIKISAVKFDARNLAYNTPDNEIVPVRNLYNTDIPNISLANITYITDNYAGALSWTAVTDNRVIGYQILITLNYLGASTVWENVGTTSELHFRLPDVYGATVYATVVPITAGNRRAPKAGWPVKTITYTAPTPPPAITISITNIGITLSWAPSTSLRLSQYEIRRGGKLPGDPSYINEETSWQEAILVETCKITTVDLPPLPLGVQVYRIKAIDSNGVYSTSHTRQQITIAPAAATTIVPNVIDNNVMLYWSASVSMQRVETYEIRRGNVYENATVLGLKSGLFTTVFENIGGAYKYWVTPVDIAGNFGISASATVSVSDPTDFTLRSFDESYLANSTYFAVTESGATHASTYVDSTYWVEGYAIFNVLLATGGYHQEIVDLGKGAPLSINSSKYTIAPNYTVISGTPTLQVDVSYSADGTTWSPAAIGLNGNAYTFRYLKVKLSVIGTGSILIDKYSITLSTKALTEMGKVYCTPPLAVTSVSGNGATATANFAAQPLAIPVGSYVDIVGVIPAGYNATAIVTASTTSSVTYACTATGAMTTAGTINANGARVPFTNSYVDIQSINVSGSGTVPVLPIYDFQDVPNPVDFKILLFTTNGDRTSGYVSYSITGVA